MNFRGHYKVGPTESRESRVLNRPTILQRMAACAGGEANVFSAGRDASRIQGL